MYNDIPFRKEPWRSRDRKPRKGCRGKVVNVAVPILLLGSAIAGWFIGADLAS